MKIEEEKAPSFTYLLCVTIALFAFSIYTIVGFWDFCYHLMDHFINDTPTMIFDRGGAFGLGCSIGLFAFGFAGSVRVISGKKAPDFIERKCIFFMLVGIALMIMLPIISSIAVNMYAYSKDYIDCDEAEKKNIWPIYRINYYTKDKATCTELVEEVKRERSGL